MFRYSEGYFFSMTHWSMSRTFWYRGYGCCCIERTPVLRSGPWENIPEARMRWGISVVAVRYGCVVAGGLAAGLAGAYLSLAYMHIWVDNMTAGRGWIALAMVIFGGWDPVRTALGAYLFGGVQALQLRLQAIGIAMPTYLLMMAPYAFTILALIIASGGRPRRRLGTPTALGMPYIRGA
jgi:general nucleoside transport system permease protein